MSFFSYLTFENALLVGILICAPYLMRGDSGRGKRWYYNLMRMFSLSSVAGIVLGEQRWGGHKIWVEVTLDDRLLCRNQIVVWCDFSLPPGREMSIFARSQLKPVPNWIVSTDELGTLPSGDLDFDRIFQVKAGMQGDPLTCKRLLRIVELREGIYRLHKQGVIGICTHKALVGLIFEDSLETKELFTVRREQLVHDLVGFGDVAKM